MSPSFKNQMAPRAMPEVYAAHCAKVNNFGLRLHRIDMRVQALVVPAFPLCKDQISYGAVCGLTPQERPLPQIFHESERALHIYKQRTCAESSWIGSPAWSGILQQR